MTPGLEGRCSIQLSYGHLAKRTNAAVQQNSKYCSLRALATNLFQRQRQQTIGRALKTSCCCLIQETDGM